MNGILVVDKPAGFTSFDVIAKLRGILAQRRLGHGGTLDPLATGVLPVFIGTATKAVDLLPDCVKCYAARVQIGVRTDTGDAQGTVMERSDCRPTLEELTAAAAAMVGKGEQIPPMVSAVRVQGRRLYELAREGKTVDRAPRPIEIFSCTVSDLDLENSSFSLYVCCSKGTYVRTLAEDLLKKCGALGHLSALQRTRSAGFTLEQAHTLDQIQACVQQGKIQDWLLETETAFAGLRAVELSEPLDRLFLNGFRFEVQRLSVPIQQGERVRVRRGKDFLGLGQAVDGKFVKVKQFWFE